MSKKFIVACTVCFIAALALMVFALVGCGHLPPNPNPSPTPSPTAQPSPTPTPGPTPNPNTMNPLRVSNGRFVDQVTGQEVKLLGAVACCDGKPSGWPWANEGFLKKIAANGGNYVHIRLGPFTQEGEAPAKMFDGDSKLYQFAPYNHLPAPISGYHSLYKMAPPEWRPGYWESLRKLIGIAEGLGIYVEVDCIDCWVLRHSKEVGKPALLSPWESHTSSIKLKEPKTWHKWWAERLALETGRFTNVIYSVGNECFLPVGDVSLAWEGGIRDAIRRVEADKGYARHPIGTNSRLPEIEKKMDYVIEHGDMAMPLRWGKPMIVNEAGPNLTAAQFGIQARRARAMGGSAFMLWRGDMSDAEFDKALAEMKKITSGQ